MILIALTVLIIVVDLLPVYLLVKRYRSNRSLLYSMAMFNLGVLFWQLSIAFINLSQDTKFLHVLAFASAPLALLGALGISITYPERRISKQTRSFLFLSFGIALVLSGITLTTKLVVFDYNLVTKRVILGALEPIYIGYLAIVFLLTVASFIRRYYTERGTRYYLQLVFFAFGTFGIFAFIFNFVLPVIIGISDFVFIGSLLASAPQFSIIYAVTVTRLYRTEFIIGRTIYVLIFAVLFYITYYAVIQFETIVWGSPTATQAYFAGTIISLAFSYIVVRLNSIIYNYLDRNIIYKNFSPDNLVIKLSRELELETTKSKILAKLKNTLEDTIQPLHSEFIVFGGENNTNYDLSLVKSFVENTTRRSILRKELTLGNRTKDPPELPFITENVVKLMEESDAQLLLTLGRGENSVGIILVGSKKNNIPYTIQDIEVLEKIAQLGAISINRSSLYAEVQQFAETLQGKIDVATSELKDANFQLSRALNSVQEARRRERDMIDVMGHELRTPMGIVRNALVILRKYDEQGKPPSDSERRRFMEMAVEAAKREINLIETLLSATKVDASRMQLHQTKIDWLDVVNDGIEGQKYKAEKQHIEIIYKKPEKGLFVYGDRNRTQEVMDNFLSNSVKYTEKGSITINVWEDDDYGWISVKDTGIGIDENDLQNLGKKFFRAKQYITEDENGETFNRPGGTGLGLYVTFNLLRIMDGKLFINSKVGEGSTFTFGLPRYKRQKAKHFDQTFDEKKNVKDRKHITLNGKAPTPPKQ